MQQHVIEHTKHGHGYKMANAKTHESSIRMPLPCFPRQSRMEPQRKNTETTIFLWFLEGVVHNEQKIPGLDAVWRNVGVMLAGDWGYSAVQFST